MDVMSNEGGERGEAYILHTWHVFNRIIEEARVQGCEGSSYFILFCENVIVIGMLYFWNISGSLKTEIVVMQYVHVFAKF